MKSLTQPLKQLEVYSKAAEKLNKETGVQLICGCIDSQKTHLAYALGESYAKRLIVTYSELKAKEITTLIDLTNKLLNEQRELNLDFIEKSEEINTTIVSLSHDIRTPLTSLDGYLQLIERTESNQEKENYLKQAQSRTKQINRLVDELFLFTKLENKAYVLELEAIDLTPIIEKVLLTFIDQFTETGHEPTIDLSESTSVIMGNNNALERIFENIIKNYFVHGKGVLTLQHEETEHELALYFSNNLKPDTSMNPDNIFTRFYKEDRSRTVHSSGLGLSIVKVLMEKMNGHVEVEMEENLFKLRLAFNKVKGG